MHTIGPERVARVRAQVCVGGRGGAESVELARSLARLERALPLCCIRKHQRAHTVCKEGTRQEGRRQEAAGGEGPGR